MQAWKHTALGSFANSSCILIFKIIWKGYISHSCAKNTCPKNVHDPQEIFSQREEKQKSNNTSFLFISQIFFSIPNSFFFLMASCHLLVCTAVETEAALTNFLKPFYPSLPFLSYYFHFLS